MQGQKTNINFEELTKTPDRTFIQTTLNLPTID